MLTKRVSSTFLALFCLFVFSGCTDGIQRIDGLSLWTGPADITVTNLTTGESVRDNYTVVAYINGTPKDFIFHHGDEMRIQFTPPAGYEKKAFSVSFSVLDKQVVVDKSPYAYELTIPDDVPVGDYEIDCSAMCKEWSEGSSCRQAISFRVE